MDAKWLQTQFRLNPDKSKTELARAIDLDPPAVSKILAGIRQIKASEYVAMRRFFGLPMEDSQARSKAQASGFVLQPLKDSANGGSDGAWIMPAGLLEGRSRGEPEQIRIFPVGDSTMAPQFRKGEHVLVDLADPTPSPPGVFVVSDGLGETLRHCEIVPGSRPLELQISPSDPNGAWVIPLKNAGILGRVIAKLEWL